MVLFLRLYEVIKNKHGGHRKASHSLGVPLAVVDLDAEVEIHDLAFELERGHVCGVGGV